jgi:hypothetical protein
MFAKIPRFEAKMGGVQRKDEFKEWLLPLEANQRKMAFSSRNKG